MNTLCFYGMSEYVITVQCATLYHSNLLCEIKRKHIISFEKKLPFDDTYFLLLCLSCVITANKIIQHVQASRCYNNSSYVFVRYNSFFSLLLFRVDDLNFPSLTYLCKE